MEVRVQDTSVRLQNLSTIFVFLLTDKELLAGIRRSTPEKRVQI